MSHELDQTVAVDGVGTGWIAYLDGDRVTIEFSDARAITLPDSHIAESPLYDVQE
jgi:hypothetical protein